MILKIRKFLLLLLAFVIVFTIIPAGNITASAASYTSDWQRWSQGASDYINVRNYGCWVVAQARLIKMLGINNSATFNPDVYLSWEQSSGHIDSYFYQVNGDTAPVDYASAMGKNLMYCGTYYSTADVWNCINNGDYGIVCVKTSGSPTGSHWILLDNERSKNTGVICCYDSWSNSSSSRSVTLSEMSYTFYSIYTYRYNTHTHSYGAWQTVTSATCTTSGTKKRVCSCGDTQTETIPALGHTWNAGEIITNAGCTEDGVKQYTCTRCGTTRTEALNATGHSPVVDNEVPATCTESGLTEGSHCSKCNAIITEQQVIPPLGHDNHIKSVERGCDSVTVVYQCERCETITYETEKDYIISDWSETYPSGVDESMIEEKIQYSYRDKDTTYQDGSSTLDGWTYNGNSDTIYGSWINADWTRYKPTESDTLRITNTKTVTDQAAHGYILYYYYYPGTSARFRYKDYGGSSGKKTLEVASLNQLTKSTEGPWYDDGTIYDGYWNGTGVTWFLDRNNSEQHPQNAVTHTEWFYQTRSKTTRYYFDKWSAWSDYSDTVYEGTENREIQTRTLYRYKIAPEGHNWQHTSYTKYSYYYYRYYNSSLGNYIYTFNSSMGGTKYTITLTSPMQYYGTFDRYSLYKKADGEYYIFPDEIWFLESSEDIQFEEPTEWIYNGDNHWHECVSCLAQQDTEAHIYDSEHDESCNVCGYIRTIKTEPDLTTHVTGVTLSKSVISLEEGKNETLTATVSPSEATNTAVTWTSSNEAVAEVSNGVITAISEGSAIITVSTADGGYTSSCTVTVFASEPNKITVHFAGETLSFEEKHPLTGKIIVAVYGDNGKLKYTDMYDVAEEINAKFHFGRYAKIMWWNGLTPVSEAKTIS